MIEAARAGASVPASTRAPAGVGAGALMPRQTEEVTWHKRTSDER
jgi:hypothetical protein